MKKGDRVQLSERGRKISRYSPDKYRAGTVVKDSRCSILFRVLWDGRRTTSTYHRDFVEKIAPENTQDLAVNIARDLYWNDHAPFRWEEETDPSIISDYLRMARIALDATHRSARPSGQHA